MKAVIATQRASGTTDTTVVLDGEDHFFRAAPFGERATAFINTPLQRGTSDGDGKNCFNSFSDDPNQVENFIRPIIRSRDFRADRLRSTSFPVAIPAYSGLIRVNPGYSLKNFWNSLRPCENPTQSDLIRPNPTKISNLFLFRRQNSPELSRRPRTQHSLTLQLFNSSTRPTPRIPVNVGKCRYFHRGRGGIPSE